MKTWIIEFPSERLANGKPVTLYAVVKEAK